MLLHRRRKCWGSLASQDSVSNETWSELVCQSICGLEASKIGYGKQNLTCEIVVGMMTDQEASKC